jgi:carbon storage regulator CsrA
VGEKILVANEVEIEVIEISRSRVKLGIRAPCHVSVLRKEAVTVSKENQMASDLIAVRGREGVGELLQILRTASTHEEIPPARRAIVRV